MDFIAQDNLPQLDRLNVEWSIVGGIRTTFHFAMESATPLTYQESIDLAEEIAPEIFDEESPIKRQFESIDARRYRQQASSRSVQLNQIITPLQLLEADLQQLENDINAANASNRDALQKLKSKLQDVRLELQQDSITENQAINRDASRFEANPYYELIEKTNTYRQYRLRNQKQLRIRVLHPDPVEYKTGADLIYELYSPDGKQVRVVVLQYKLWDGKRLYSDDRMQGQLNKMEKMVCDGNICQQPSGDLLYRLPFCSAFLRPTDKLQDRSSRLVTSSWHVPLCQLESLWQPTPTRKKLELNNVKNSAVSELTFEEFFNTEKLGSRWLNLSELKLLYDKYDLWNPKDFTILSQVFSGAIPDLPQAG